MALVLSDVSKVDLAQTKGAKKTSGQEWNRLRLNEGMEGHNL